MINALEDRKADHPVETLFVARWSPRAMSGEPLTDDEIRTLFEAARWAPSTYNEQEWRFLYARRDTPQWQDVFRLARRRQPGMVQGAAMLVVILAHKVFSKNGKPNPVHLFDSGCAFENLALQGTAMGLVVHGMQGFDYDKAQLRSKCRTTTQWPPCSPPAGRATRRIYRNQCKNVRSRPIASRSAKSFAKAFEF